MEKPKPAVGQRWAPHADYYFKGRTEFTVVSDNPGNGACRWGIRVDAGPEKGHVDLAMDSWFASATFLGGPQPSGAPREAAKCNYGCSCPLHFQPAAQPVPADCVAPAKVAGLRPDVAAAIKLPPGRDTYNLPSSIPAPTSCYTHERQHAVTGMPITALEAIRSRKPPEPYQPSIDDWDLLPDA